ncbi:MAG TPA: bifunctional nuclease family protein [Acidobacteriaceae bacterium]|nr:bifunctional nuclease family protein [Acidobacteriaceae bacterium]
MKTGTEPGDATSTTPSAEVEMQIRGLMIDPQTNMPIVILKDISSDALLPIWVGIFEANAIAMELDKTATPRPMTHDLMRNLAQGLNAVVKKVVVSELREETFYAMIWMEQEGETVTLDARPSDAIALALRWDCPIYAARTVLENARKAAENAPVANSDEIRRWLENLNDDDMGRYKM